MSVPSVACGHTLQQPNQLTPHPICHLPGSCRERLLTYSGLQALQKTVRSIRNARAEYGVELGRKIPATVLAADPELRSAPCLRALSQQAQCLYTLLCCLCSHSCLMLEALLRFQDAACEGL